MAQVALVFIGGDAPDPRVGAHLPSEATVVAADSGWEHAVALGRVPAVLVGDMDSIEPEHLVRARSIATVVEFPADKDMTDTELALREATGMGCAMATVVSGGGDRLDHVLAMVHSLAACTIPVNAFIGATRLDFAVPGRRVSLEVTRGSTMSLVPIGGDAGGVTTSGLKWELSDANLSASESRGISNVAVASEVAVTVATGTLAVLSPDWLAAPPTKDATR